MAATAVLFVGTTDGLAIYRATPDRDWTRTAHTLAGMAIVAIEALSAEMLIVAVRNDHAMQSVDGGATWRPTDSAAPEPVGVQVATLHGPGRVSYPRLSGATAYARIGGTAATLLGAGAGGMLLFRSQDDGIHWEPAGMDDGSGTITTIVPSAGKPDAAWAGSSSGALLHTGDSGRTWRTVATEPAAILCLASATSF